MSDQETTQETTQENTVAEVIDAPVSQPPAQPVRMKKTALAAILEGDLDAVQMGDDVFRNLFDTSLAKVKEDEMVHGTVVSVTKDEILVDIGFKLLILCIN